MTNIYIIMLFWLNERTAVTCTKFVECTLVIPHITNHSRGKALVISAEFC